jgi:hypothetical protein
MPNTNQSTPVKEDKYQFYPTEKVTGGYRYFITIDRNAFGNKKLNDFEDKQKDKKYNLKIAEQDVLLLDLLAEKLNISRNSLINILLDKILLSWLKGVKGQDTQVLIATYADNLCSEVTNSMNTSWVNKLFEFDTRESQEMRLQFGEYEMINPSCHYGYDELSAQKEEALKKGDTEQVQQLGIAIDRLFHSDEFIETKKRLFNIKEK